MARTVLILEDEPLIAWDIEEELISRGWDVIGTFSGIEKALECLEDTPPDLAVLDINVGPDTSYNLARRCQSLGVAVVFLSGASSDDRPQDLQFTPLCAKPVDYNTLQRALQRAVTDNA